MKLLENNITMDNEKKSEYYQIVTIKIIYEEILQNFKNINGFVNEIKLSSEQLLKIPEIKPILLKFKLFICLIQKDNLYQQKINYLLFNPLCQELCHKLNDLLEEQNKDSFIQLILFLFKNTDCFKVLDLLYPYDNEEINKNKELEFSAYYIYLWINLYKNKNNFSVRINNKEYNIKFEEKQDKKIYCYFILNEKQSSILSIGSYIGMYKGKNGKKNQNKNQYKRECIKEASKEKTKYLLSIIIQNFNILYQDKIIGYDNNFNNEKKFESFNFYPKKLSSLIPRIWPIIFNFENYKNFFNYLENAFIYLEKDAIKNLVKLFNNINNEKLIEKSLKKLMKYHFFVMIPVYYGYIDIK